MLKELLGENFEAIMQAAQGKGFNVLLNSIESPEYVEAASMAGLNEQIAGLTGERDAATALTASLQNEIAGMKAATETQKFESALKAAIGSYNPNDYDIVRGLVNTEGMVVGEDGTISGLAELMNALKTEKGFLFKADEVPPHAGAAPGDKEQEIQDEEEVRKIIQENL